MKVSYKKLWKLLIDKDMKKKRFRKDVLEISHYTINKLNHGEKCYKPIFLGKICKALGCTMNDIMEFIDDDSAQ